LCNFIDYYGNKLLINLIVKVTEFTNLSNCIHIQLQQQRSASCYHQCTICAVIFHCDDILYPNRQLGLVNRCENPFYYGKCNICKEANSGGTRRKTNYFSM